MLRKSFNLIADSQNQPRSSDIFEEEPTSLPYSNFPVPFIRVSQTVKRFKPGTKEMVSRNSIAPRQPQSEKSSRVVDTFADLELRLGINANKSQVEEKSEILQGTNLKNTGMEGLPHPNQIYSGKKKRPSVKRPPAASGNDINEHLLELQRKQQLLAETKPVESVLVTKGHFTNGSVVAPPTPSVVLETTKQCFVTFGADSALSWTSSRVSSLSSTGLAREGNALSSGGTPWEGQVASVQRQTVCAGRPQDVAVRTDRKRKMLSSALNSQFDHFLCLYRNSLLHQSSSSDDDDDDEDEFSAARFLGIRGSRPLAFSNDFSHVFASNASSDDGDGDGDGDEINSAYFLGAKEAGGGATPLTCRKDFSHLFASNVQPAIIQSTAKSSGKDFPGQRSPFISASSSTMFIKDQVLGFNERSADWSHESSFQAYEKNDKSLIMEE